MGMTWFTGDSAGYYAVFWSSMTPEEEREVLAVLDSVGAGVTAKCTATAWNGNSGNVLRQTFAGNVEWVLSNGWRVVVFNDCVSWDYVDSVTAPDGRHWEFPCDSGDEGTFTWRIAHWHPSKHHEAAWLSQRLAPHPTAHPGA